MFVFVGQNSLIPKIGGKNVVKIIEVVVVFERQK